MVWIALLTGVWLGFGAPTVSPAVPRPAVANSLTAPSTTGSRDFDLVGG